MISPSSPCIRNCCLDEKDICLGCFRSIEEILQWADPATTSEQKEQILKKSAERKYTQHHTWQ